MSKNENTKKVYVAGDMLTKGSILQRIQEAEELRKIGLDVHSPIEDKEINDKKEQTEETNNKLAERIFEKDSNAIMAADTIIIEPQPFAIGTLVELGQMAGHKQISESLNKMIDETEFDSVSSMKEAIKEKINFELNKEILVHLGDIRRNNNLNEMNDRRSWSVNQYLYGAILYLTEGKGIKDFEDIIDKLK